MAGSTNGDDKRHEQVDEPRDGAEARADRRGAEADGDGERDEVARLQAEAQDLRERLMRQQADFENTRKRLRREMEESGQRALVRFVRPLLPELDSFDLALQAADPARFQDFAMGVSMIRENLVKILQGAGIEQIPAEGVFDPHLHEVVQEVEAADKPRGTIVEVLRGGYRLGDQVIRAAQVVVSRPPKDGDPTAET